MLTWERLQMTSPMILCYNERKRGNRMAKRKEYSELTFIDDFMFCKILTSRPELCKELLELILGIKIKRIKFPEAQKAIEQTYDGRGIRLDVYIEDANNTVYDLEMQTTEQKDLPKRTRYYQGMIDLNLIQRGSKFRALKKSYIIFICLSDPFGRNLPIYTFENRCVQDDTITLGDDAYKVIINADGNRDGLSDEMKHFLDFLQGKDSDGKLASELDKAVKDVISKKDWEVEYMTLYMKYQEEREEGAIEATIKTAREFGASNEIIIGKLVSNFDLTEDEAREKISEYEQSLQLV